MQRYFINEDLTSKQQLILPDDDLHHVKKVMRNINGDEIICIDNAGQVYYGVIEDIEITPGTQCAQLFIIKFMQ